MFFLLDSLFIWIQLAKFIRYNFSCLKLYYYWPWLFLHASVLELHQKNRYHIFIVLLHQHMTMMLMLNLQMLLQKMQEQKTQQKMDKKRTKHLHKKLKKKLSLFPMLHLNKCNCWSAFYLNHKTKIFLTRFKVRRTLASIKPERSSISNFKIKCLMLLYWQNLVERKATHGLTISLMKARTHT